MDEHLGLTSNIASQLLHKTHFHQLIQDDATRDGAVQRLHNILVQFPSLLSSASAAATQNNVFRSMETVMRMITHWNDSAWSSILSAASSSNPSSASDSSSGKKANSESASNSISHTYLLALAIRILALRASFTTNQQSHMDHWTNTLIVKLNQYAPSGSSNSLVVSPPTSSDEIDDERPHRTTSLFEQLQETTGYRIIDAHISTVQRDFVETDPFAHMQIASFLIPGVKQADVTPAATPKRSGSGKKHTGSTSSSSSSPDIPFFFLPRTKCPSCDRSQPFYCTHCYQVIHPLAQDKLPKVELPLQLDILLHSNVIRSKSTALQSVLLVEPKEMIREFSFPGKLPQYDPCETAVIFPSDSSISLYQLAKRAQNAAPLANIADEAHSNTPAAELTLSTLRRVIFLEGTWSEAALMLQHPSLRHLTHIRLDFTSSGSTDSDLSSPTTAFWRYQRFGRGFLSSIEAIYHLFHQYCHVKSLNAASDKANTSLDNLLWLFAMSHQRLRQFYQRQPHLLTPITGSSNE